jgi:hypothetical protein
MRFKRAFMALALIVVLAAVSYAQTATNQEPATPVFRVEVSGYIVADFSARVAKYFEVRSELEKRLPPLRVTEDPAEIRRAVHELATQIRAARAGAKQGDIFTPAISRAFRKALVPEIDAATWAAISDDNPGEFSTTINGIYPEGNTFSTVPPNILAVLPRLPEDIQYCFLGRHLILLDTRANVILDRIPNAVQCSNDDKSKCHR